MTIKSSMLCGLFGALALGTAAQAQSPCKAQTPAVGAQIHGPVLHIEDDRHLCVALGSSPDQWVELTLADEPLQQAASRIDTRGALMATAFAQNVTCRMVEQGVAACTLDDRSLRTMSREPAAYVAGKTWR